VIEWHQYHIMTTTFNTGMSRDQYTERLVQLVSALVASGRYKVEWHEHDTEFKGIDSDGEHISLVGTAVGLLREIHTSWDPENPLCEDPAGGFYDPTPPHRRSI
jgi:hypothetical protein